MTFISVKSSNIKEMAHEDNVLQVRFHNSTEYHYSGVPEDVFEELVSAASVGRSFNQLIKSKASILIIFGLATAKTKIPKFRFGKSMNWSITLALTSCTAGIGPITTHASTSFR